MEHPCLPTTCYRTALIGPPRPPRPDLAGGVLPDRPCPSSAVVILHSGSAHSADCRCSDVHAYDCLFRDSTGPSRARASPWIEESRSCEVRRMPVASWHAARGGVSNGCRLLVVSTAVVDPHLAPSAQLAVDYCSPGFVKLSASLQFYFPTHPATTPVATSILPTAQG